MYLKDYMPKSQLVSKTSRIDKPGFDVIDAHTHWGSILFGDNYEDKYDTENSVHELRKHGIRKVINLDGQWGGGLNRMLAKTKGFEDFIVTFGSVDVSLIDKPGFETYVRKTLIHSHRRGIRGLKFLKELSLGIKDSRGKYIPVDDSRLAVIWQTAAELQIPVTIHIADPTAFFEPVDRYNERYEELERHPKWSFHSAEYFDFDKLMEMQENLLSTYSDTIFNIAHVGSWAENLSFVSNCLDKYPNMYIDIAARIPELGRQPYSSKDFFKRHQDRILFATDNSSGTEQFGIYSIYYRFLETRDEYFDYSNRAVPGNGRWKIYGLGLESDILEKVYLRNAESFLECRKYRGNTFGS